jgi:serine/threonine-protein kinase
MQFLDGVDLARLVRQQGRLEVNQACEYIRQAALGLQHIHEHGMVHRDIKPSNLVVTATQPPVIKILDLGLARLDEDPSAPSQRVALTRVGTVMGTPDYMAPEQALHSRHADIRSDLYSLGCTLYFVLAGRPPFPGGDAIEKMLKHQLDDPTPIEELRPEVPEPVRAILNRMMAKKKEERYQTPQEVVLALQAFLEPPVRAIPVMAAPEAAPAALTVSAPPTPPTPAAAATNFEPVDCSETPFIPVISSPLVRIPSRQADWGLWIFLACACAGAIVCLVVALIIVLR